ncbi:MAG: GntR family transcriptional regulator [Victivallales bacterium]|nr:GntR family transcriptional regulator [Victivallales bacterium]
MQVQTSEHIAYIKIRDFILAGELKPGEFLAQRKLAEKTGTAVATVRNSLRLLENDGLIENVPKWGVRIPVDTEERIRDRYFMREILEAAAVKRIRNLDAETVKKAEEQLMELGRKCDEISESPDTTVGDFAQVHSAFHLLIAKLSGSPMLEAALRKINFNDLMLWNAKSGWKHKKRVSSHQIFVRDIFGLPEQEAEEVIKLHINNGMLNDLEALQA